MFGSTAAFSGFSVNDIEAARDFYGNKLGLDVYPGEMGVLNITLGPGQRVIAYPKPNHQPATYTMLNFVVDDIDKAVSDLNAAGIQMEQYGMAENPQDERGIARDPNGPAIAWFTDPAGNILAVLQQNA
jgi:predicted enzyme related to lactoylglutathione lyase